REAERRLAGLRDAPVLHRQRAALGELAVLEQRLQRRVELDRRRPGRIEAPRELDPRGRGRGEIDAARGTQEREEGVEHGLRIADPRGRKDPGMCRFTLYLGPAIRMSALVTEPRNSLIHQSFESQEREE